MLLSFPGVGVCTDRRFDPLVGGQVVVLPDRHYAAVFGLPPADQAGAMTEPDWQQVGAEEVMKDRQVLPDRLIDAHPIDHTYFYCADRGPSERCRAVISDRQRIGEGSESLATSYGCVHLWLAPPGDRSRLDHQGCR